MYDFNFRISAIEALHHPYFKKSLNFDISANIEHF